MTQDELKLVLDALKWCHGGEPCGTSEAIAVVEKALGNVATNDTSKEYVDEMQKQRHEQEPVAWPCLIAEADFSENTVILAMQCTDYKVSAGNHWLSNTPPQRSESSGKPAAWVGLTNDELTDLFYNTNLGQQSAVAQAIALLKERNT